MLQTACQSQYLTRLSLQTLRHIYIYIYIGVIGSGQGRAIQGRTGPAPLGWVLIRAVWFFFPLQPFATTRKKPRVAPPGQKRPAVQEASPTTDGTETLRPGRGGTHRGEGRVLLSLHEQGPVTGKRGGGDQNRWAGNPTTEAKRPGGGGKGTTTDGAETLQPGQERLHGGEGRVLFSRDMGKDPRRGSRGRELSKELP